MISNIAMGALTGMAFGVVLYKVAAMRHSRVLGMLTFADLKIMKFAFTAIAVSSFGYGLADITGVAAEWSLVPRINAYTGWAHVLGGAVFGVSMAATGLCPGTAACRASANVGKSRHDGLLAVLGLFVGVALFAAVKQPMVDSGIIGSPKSLTLHGVLGLPYAPMAMLLGTFFIVLSVMLDRFGPEPKYDIGTTSFKEKLQGEWHWLPAGIIGGLTVLWATQQDGYIGFSGSVLALYGWGLDAVGSPSVLVPEVSATIVWRAALIGGVAIGAYFAHLGSRPIEWPSADDATPDTFQSTAALSSFGAGTGLAFGAMVGGGCTTGAFISAFPTLSLGSFAMGGTFFVVALVTAGAMRMSGSLGFLSSPPQAQTGK